MPSATKAAIFITDKVAKFEKYKHKQTKKTKDEAPKKLAVEAKGENFNLLWVPDTASSAFVTPQTSKPAAKDEILTLDSNLVPGLDMSCARYKADSSATKNTPEIDALLMATMASELSKKKRTNGPIISKSLFERYKQISGQNTQILSNETSIQVVGSNEIGSKANVIMSKIYKEYPTSKSERSSVKKKRIDLKDQPPNSPSTIEEPLVTIDETSITKDQKDMGAEKASLQYVNESQQLPELMN